MDLEKKWSLDKSQTHQTMDSDTREDALVEEFGYAPAYARVFKSIGSMSMTLAMASPMMGIFIMCSIQITYGGYWGLTWGWIIPAILFFPWALATAELASSMPVNGTSYWWVAALSPPSISRPLSFVTGMTNVMNAITSMASFSWAVSESLSTLIGMQTGWESTNGMNMGIAIAVSLLWLGMACMRMQDSSYLYIFNATVVLITTAIFMIGIPVTHAAQGLAFASASDVFGEYSNFSDWNRPVAVPYTFLTAAWVITGWNAPAAIAEETLNASKVAPRSIVSVYSLMSILGLIVCLVLSFCITDIEAAAADPTGFPAFTLVMGLWGPKVGLAFLLIAACNTMLGGASVLFMMSCQTAAFARDGGLVWNDKLSYVWSFSNMPIFSSIFVTAGGILMLFLAFSPIASSIIYSLAVISVMAMYALPMVFRIFDGGRWVPGPWSYGWASKPIHAWSILSISYILVLECFPPMANWTGATLNYNWAVLLAAILLSWILWLAKGSRSYRGVDQDALRAWRAHHTAHSDAEEPLGEVVVVTGIRPGGSTERTVVKP